MSNDRSGMSATIHDLAWFAQNRPRAHRARAPFPGEFKEATPAGYTLVVLLQHTKPDCWTRTGFYVDTRLLPVPDDEATIHALFEMAMRREPLPSSWQAFDALIGKYKVRARARPMNGTIPITAKAEGSTHP